MYEPNWYELSEHPTKLKQQISVISEDWDKIFENLDRCDGTNDGKINRDSLINWIGKMDFETKVDCEKHLHMPPKEIKRLIAKADVNKDGLIDKKEFLDLVQNKGLVLSKQQQNVMRQYLKVRIFFLASQTWSRKNILISKSGSILAPHYSCTRDCTL